MVHGHNSSGDSTAWIDVIYICIESIILTDIHTYIYTYIYIYICICHIYIYMSHIYMCIYIYIYIQLFLKFRGRAFIICVHVYFMSHGCWLTAANTHMDSTTSECGLKKHVHICIDAKR